MTTEERADINRQNAQKSTGPKTPEGKKRASLSALRHGLTGQIVVMPDEDLKAYKAFLQRFHTAHKPQGPDEEQCLQVMADTSWKVNRAKAWTDQITAAKSECENDGLNLSEDNEPELNAALAIAAVVARITKDLSNLSMYEQRQWKMYERAHDRLRMLQNERREREQAELEEAALLLETHEAAEAVKQQDEESYTPAPYQPQADGFVFQVPEIKLHIRRRDRLACARQYRFDGSKHTLRAFPQAA